MSLRPGNPAALVPLIVAAALLDLVLIQPNHPGAVTWRALRMAPLELPVLTLGLFALGRAGRPLAWLAALALTLMAAVKMADLGSHVAFARGFDPVIDLPLVSAGLNLLAGTAGAWAAPAAVAGVAALLLLLLLLLGWAGTRWARAGAAAPPGLRLAAGAVALAFAVLSAAEIRTALNGWRGWNPPGDAFTARLTAEHIRDIGRSRAAFAEFSRAAGADAFAGRPGLFAALAGRDVAVVFIESYGRTSFDTPEYAALHDPTRQAGAAALEARGLGMLSGWLSSPVRGGQSWLAHATLAAGLPVSDQRRYGALIASGRQTLYHLAAAAGYETLVVEPAITMPWPEGPKLGFAQVYAAADLGYRGRPFNWVTMPDQFTLAAYDRLPRGGRPRLAEIALISSHAPWTPVPRPIPWEEIGDGSAFDAMAQEGPSPRALWSDRAAVRRHYALTIDYALRVVLDWAALPRDRAPLLIVLGDHQPAGFVALSESPDVPVHLIGPPEVLALFSDWGWTPGPGPAPELPAWPMAAFRDRFLAAVSIPEDGS